MRWLLRNKKFQALAYEFMHGLPEVTFPAFQRKVEEEFGLWSVLYKDEAIIMNRHEDEFIRVKPAFKRDYPREAFHGNGFDIEWHDLEGDSPKA